MNAYIWWFSMHFAGETRYIVIHGYIKWFVRHITVENTVYSYA